MVILILSTEVPPKLIPDNPGEGNLDISSQILAEKLLHFGKMK